jgi:hypothetical protein
MKKVKNKLRVIHFPQVGSLKKGFVIDVLDEIQAFLIINAISIQHLWLEKNRVIPDFSNAIIVQMWDEDSDGEGNPDWIDYWNEDEGMDWDEFEETYLKNNKELKVLTASHIREINKF